MDRREFACTLAAFTATVGAGRVTAAAAATPARSGAATIKDFGAKGDGITDDSKAFMDAIRSGATTVRVGAGRYVVKNVELTNVALELDEAAVLVHTLGRKDVGIRMSSGSRIVGGQFEVTNSVAPLHGAYGCAIAIGYYANIATEQSNISVERVKLICKNAAPRALAISIAGAASNIRIRDVEANGAFGIACQAHWGGVFDEENPDTSTVSASAHPHNITIENLTCGKDGGHVGSFALSLAGVYDVKVRNVVSRSWKRVVLVTPGDVYAQVASAGEASKVMTGIEVDGVTIIDPPSSPGATSGSAVLVNGSSQTRRTPKAPTYTADNPCSITIRNIRISNGTGTPYSGAPLVNCYYVGKLQMHVASVTGFENSTSTLFQMRNCTDSGFVAEHVGQPLGKCMTADANVNCSMSIETAGNSNSLRSTSARAMTCGTQGAGKTTLASNVSVGDVTASLNGIAGGFTLVKGTRLYTPRGFLTVARSILVAGKGATQVRIEPSKLAQGSGDAVRMTGELLSCKVSVTATSVYVPVEFENSTGCEVDINASNSGKCDVLLTGGGNSSLKLQCKSSNACAIDDGSGPANVSLSPGREMTHTGSKRWAAPPQQQGAPANPARPGPTR
jgi:hypothetical protein